MRSPPLSFHIALPLFSLPLQRQSMPTDMRALFGGCNMLAYSHGEQKLLCSSA